MILNFRNTKKVEDEILMVRVGNGDINAFNELYDRYNRRLYYFFFRMLGSEPETANDFLQDLFLKIIDKPELYNPDYTFSKWVFSIAHNMCKNEYRRREQSKKIFGGRTEPHHLEVCENEQDDKEYLFTSVFKELDALDENYKTILLLKYKENFSLKEISDIMDLPEGTVKSRLYYARLELSKRVKKEQSL